MKPGHTPQAVAGQTDVAEFGSYAFREVLELDGPAIAVVCCRSSSGMFNLGPTAGDPQILAAGLSLRVRPLPARRDSRGWRRRAGCTTRRRRHAVTDHILAGTAPSQRYSPGTRCSTCRQATTWIANDSDAPGSDRDIRPEPSRELSRAPRVGRPADPLLATTATGRVAGHRDVLTDRSAVLDCRDCGSRPCACSRPDRDDLQAHLTLPRVGEQPPSSTPTSLPVRTRTRHLAWPPLS